MSCVLISVEATKSGSVLEVGGTLISEYSLGLVLNVSTGQLGVLILFIVYQQ